MRVTDVSQIVRRARLGAGLTQAELAGLAGTRQSAIAAYEAGSKQPSLAVFERIVNASGHTVSVALQRDQSIFRLVELATALAGTEDEDRRLRLVLEFLRGAVDDGVPIRLLVSAEPPPTGDRRYDALLAAIAEDLCVHHGLTPPGWVRLPDRFLPVAWWISDLPSAKARALVHTPASYRRRGVMVDRRDLLAA